MIPVLLFCINMSDISCTVYALILAESLILNLDGDISFGDLPHVESDCRDHIFAEMPRLKEKTQMEIFAEKNPRCFFLWP